ncbi:DUF11 domain-containing protein [Mariprofundus sp. EBB-1]|uniref:DUF11 domain-containing protein n=1 Tax=Mariprofundus sp. EBB-1 TaxID=2650971 RepID=UPI000EF22544|nr:DUF11 domain-containing protein [Mariprofundus sp. EBB-1]RLL52301.1 DUF11 domain-containing protein [Mariprofundus sp. EBB-1]
MQAGLFTLTHHKFSLFRNVGLFLTLILIPTIFAGAGVAGPTGDLYIKLNGDQSSQPSASVSYSVTIGNNGPGLSGSHGVRIVIPSAFTKVQHTLSTLRNDCIQHEEPDATTIRCKVSSINDTDSYTVQITANAPVETGRYQLESYVSRPVGKNPNPRNDHSVLFTTVQKPVPAKADMSISMKSIPEKVLVGDTFEYVLTIRNHGPASAASTKISTQVPFSTEFISITSNQGQCAAPPNAGGLSVLTCNLGSLMHDDLATVTVKLRAPLKSGTVTGQANISSETDDPDLKNNSTTNTTQIINKTIPIQCFSFFGLFGY